jgi:hypothetical protein
MMDAYTRDLVEACTLALECREAQRDYFATRRHEDLARARKAELALDAALAVVLSGQIRLVPLTGDEGGAT